MKTLDTTKPSKNSLGPLLLGIATLAAGVAIARADKQKLAAGAVIVTNTVHDFVGQMVTRMKQPTGLTSKPHAVEPMAKAA